MSFNQFLKDLTGLKVSFCMDEKVVENKKIMCSSYAIRNKDAVTFVFVHFNAKSIVTTLKAMFDIIHYADEQPDVSDLASMLIFIESNIEPCITSQYIVQQFREIMIFLGSHKPNVFQHFLDTKDYFDGKNKGAPEGVTVH